jgi:predicted deacylase
MNSKSRIDMRLTIASIFLLLSTNCFSHSHMKAKTEEAYWINEINPQVFALLKSRPELTIDHIKANGFELYGPKGLALFLKQNVIEFEVLKNANNLLTSQYPTPESIEKDLKSINLKYPSITKLYSIGKSVKNRDLWVMKLSKNAKTDDKRPEFKYIANMHGDEIVGREVMLKFIKECTEKYGTDPQFTNLLDKFQIHILVSMNPDGAATSSRGNGNRVDLNRDFPDFSTTDNQDTLENREPETQAVMKWQSEHQFKLSANFHGGAEVVNYAWDTVPDRFPEETLMKELSREYANNAPYIAASTAFENGITNGFAWYEVNGGMQDWSIYWRKDFQVTIELSNNKWPDYSKINYYYEQNRPALIKLIERTDYLLRK